MNRVALVGLGPHAKRIYLKYLKEHDKKLELLIEVKEKVENMGASLYCFTTNRKKEQ